MMSSILAHQHEFIAVDKSTVLSVNFIYRKTVRPKPRQPVLLFVHGLGSNKAIWTETAEAMCSFYGYTCILVDLRGHGDSADAVVGTAKSSTHSVDAHSPFTGRVDNSNAMPGKNDGSYTLAQSADDLAAILRSFHTNSDKWIRQTAFDPEINGGSSSSSLDVSLPNANNTKENALESFIAIGHSYGGNLAVEIAVRHPSLLSYLVLVDGGYIDLQGKFPDFNSCLLVLRPPSFAGISAEELEHIIRSAWAQEGKVTHKGEECNDEEMGSNPSTGPVRRSSSSSDISEELLRCDGSSSSAGCWSEIGIQAMLKNFRTIRFDPNTVTTATDRCASTTKSSHASSTISISYEKNSFSSCTKNRSISSTNSSSANNNNNRSIISSSSSSSSRHECGSTSNRDSNVSINSKGISGFTVSCVQPVLTFQRYIMLLEDLWNRRPVDQFSALYDHAITSHSTIENPITNSTVFHGNNGILKSIVFLPSGATSPFSADKEKDIQKSVAAVQGWDRGGSDKVRDREMARICRKEKKTDTDNVRNEIRDRDRDRDRGKVTNSRPGHRDDDNCRGWDESTHICPSQRGGNRNSQREEVGRVGVGVGEGDNNNKVVTEVLRINVKSTEIGIGTKVELKVQVQAEHRKLLSKQPNYEDSDKNNNDDNHDDKNSNDNDSDKNDVDNDNSDDDNNHDNGDGDDDNYDDNHNGSVCNTQCGIQYMISIKPFLLAGHNIPLQMPLQLAHTIHNYLT